jgi:hypothetical protein
LVLYSFGNLVRHTMRGAQRIHRWPTA